MDIGKMVMDIVMWTIVAAIIVLVIMNAGKFQTAVGSISGFWLGETALITGSGYKAA